MATIISTKTSGVGGLEVTGDATGILQLASNNGTTAVTVDASQNVGIGTASPSYKLQVNGFIGVTDGTSTIRLANSGGVGLVSTITNHPLAFQTNDTEQARITTNGLMQFNSGYGSVATAYGCRAWVNFNGTGTVAIRASGNVTSITDNGTGNYTVNFTTALVDNNYTTVTTARRADGGAGGGGDINVLSAVLGSAALTYNSAVTTNSVRVGTGTVSGLGFYDCDCNVAIFR